VISPYGLRTLIRRLASSESHPVTGIHGRLEPYPVECEDRVEVAGPQPVIYGSDPIRVTEGRNNLLWTTIEAKNDN
jgi:hypothetical protein